MPSKKDRYVWIPGDPPPFIEAHSLAKHDVFASYLKRYVEVLAQNPRVSKLPITFIDGFSGGGVYRNELNHVIHDGSPLLILKAVKEAEFRVNQQRQSQRIRTPFEVCAEFHFIDIIKSNIDFLKLELAHRDYSPRIDHDIFLHAGDFLNLNDAMINRIKSRNRNGRCIFLLDQYGYENVPMPTLKHIFSQLHHAEIILTFATDHICHYVSEKNREMFKQKFEQIGLSPDLVDQLLQAGQSSFNFRRIIQALLIEPLHQATSAKYFTPFYIVSRESNKAYWLIHLSMHPRARDVMLQEHWAHHNTFEHYGGPGLKMLGYSPRQDLYLGDEQPLPFQFEETAKKRAQSSLLSQIPERLAEYRDGIRASDFLAAIANETPAHNKQILEVLTQLSASKEIIVDDQDGKKRRHGSVIRPSDIIHPTRQVIIDFAGKKQKKSSTED